MKARILFTLALLASLAALLAAIKIFSEHYRIIGYGCLAAGLIMFAESAILFRKIQ